LQFTKLRVSGFKSFVDPTELEITPGLSGIVGPNGCGKSNLVEALRWVMGETSAKKMRGGGMDDVIFGGSADRPSRNIAEVILTLDNADRRAPAIFNEHEELEIARRIERESGSVYRVNGKEVRARDVQLLFADLATGARSGALVSQGRIGALINAKPTDRRILLEEAAGISGLHSRRHEAELRLRAAETNLERLEDVLAALDAQLRGLKKQARQAARYRNIGDLIRKAEAILLHLRWTETEAELADAQADFDAVVARVNELTADAARQSAAEADAAAALPALRDAEAAAAARLQRLIVARESLDEEEHRLRAARADAAARLSQIEKDGAREQALRADAEAAVARLADEAATLDENQAELGAASREAESAVAQAEDEVDEGEALLAAVTEAILAEEARREAATRRIAEIESRIAVLRERAAAIASERETLSAKAEADDAIAAAGAAVTAAEAAVAGDREAAEAAEKTQAEARAAESEARESHRARAERLAELRAEQRALQSLLEGEGNGGAAPIIDAIDVEPGYEDALGAALGEDLTAAEDSTAPVRWRALPALREPPALPEPAVPLSQFVKAPGALDRRLSQIGVVADAAAAATLADRLHIGQRLVSRDGGLWRWDGFIVVPGAETGAARRLAQRNRLATVEQELETADGDAARAQAVFDESRQAAAAALEAERTARAKLRQSYADLDGARDRLAALERENAQTSNRLAALDEAGERLRTDVEEAERELADVNEAAAAQSDLEAKRAEQSARRETLTAARGRLIDRRSRHDRLLREEETRAARLDAIEQETGNWRKRAEDAAAQIDELEARAESTRADIERLDAAPAELDAKRRALVAEIEDAEGARRQAGDELAAAETALAAVTKALRECEAALADAREARARAEGAVAQVEQVRAGLVERMRERLDAGPDQALAVAEIRGGEQLPDVDAVEARLERLLRERDNMGPVNLRAEQEAKDLQEQIDGLEQEKQDLIEAIARLRQGINELNREGRERLLASFKLVNEHFEKLFARLFGGGRAHLKLIESDDPLDAGLEIFASPPGKKLQVLSLLSGGEQALTALALLFAVFLTNPAPICVLDEVDAPLDDANVDRFCTMLAEIAHASETRFLIVTHHRMTMARMERLYGVTMPEQGVSQLVSVDLKTAEEIRDSA